MYNTDLKDETFDISNAKQYSLLLQVLPLNFSYAIFDNQRSKFVVLRDISFKNSKTDYLNNLKELFKKDDSLNIEYQNTKAIIGSQNSIFVPKALFNKDKIFDILNFNTPIKKTETVLYDELKNDTFNIYTFDKEILSEIKNTKFKNIELYNQGTVLFSKVIQKKASTKKRLIVDVNSVFFEIIYIENNQLIFRNIFSFTNETDFVFYIISVIDKFKIDNENDELSISGILTTNSKEIELLRKYIKRIRFKRTKQNYSYVFNDIDINIYTNLLNLQSCE